MKRFPFDLHVHSCLSPCGDNEMTPCNIAGMAAVNSLAMLALTDHNTTRNCRAFYEACRRYGILPIAGVELTTAEDVHLVSLFPTLEAAEDFDRDLRQHRVLYPASPEIFGDQLIMDSEDRVIGREEHLLPNATMLSLEDAVRFVRGYGAVVYPAHIDREANGIISVLGAIPPEPAFTAYELHDPGSKPAYRERYGLSGMVSVISSDAHYLWDISDAANAFSLEGEDEKEYREDLFRILRGEREAT
jgi:hypothetical protein